jgi:hypothetical protein
VPQFGNERGVVYDLRESRLRVLLELLNFLEQGGDSFAYRGTAIAVLGTPLLQEGLDLGEKCVDR